MTERRGSADATCPRGPDAVALVQDALDAAERASMLEHLADCEACRELVSDTRAILGTLGADGAAAGRRRVPKRSPVRSTRMLVAASALVAVLAGWALQANVPGSGQRAQPVPRVERPPPTAVAWVESNLASDGTWYAFARTGPRAREPGLHAFGLLALVRGTEAEASAGRLDAVRDAAAWLIGQQADDGSIGASMAPGNFAHPVATLALVEAAEFTGDPSIRSAAERALAHIVDRRSTLWGVGGQTGQAAWTLAALSRARQGGFAGLDEVTRRGRALLGSVAMDSPSGDLLADESFWELALGGAPPRPGEEPCEDLFSASLAVLASAAH